MHTPLNASATTAGALMSGATFEVPPYQREYSWVENEEVSEFWNDLRNALNDDSYFLGLVILTDEGKRKHVVDGQQRILTLTLLAAALYHEALGSGRKALAERIQADFLRSIDYQTDETLPRVVLSDHADNETLQAILNAGLGNLDLNVEEDSLSQRMQEAFKFLQKKLREDLAQDPFKRLGVWTDFITNHLYFAVFVHPDSAAAYRVFEVINTRGRELTTADLLKNYVLSQTPPGQREDRYKEWRSIARQFPQNGTNSFVQYIRHVVTVEGGHILPKDLFDFLARRTTHGNKKPPTPDELMGLLRKNLPLYLQMIDPTLDGPADPEFLKIFAALNSLGVIAVRPILLAMSEAPNSLEGMNYILRLVVRRIVVGNLGTGNVERRFGEAAKMIHDIHDWHAVEEELRDLNPARDQFVGQISRRSFNKESLTFLRRSIVTQSTTPEKLGVLHFIVPRQGVNWAGLSEEDALFWGGTIANTFLATMERRPKEATSWEGFRKSILTAGIQGEWIKTLMQFNAWNADAMETISGELAEVAGNVWY